MASRDLESQNEALLEGEYDGDRAIESDDHSRKVSIEVNASRDRLPFRSIISIIHASELFVQSLRTASFVSDSHDQYSEITGSVPQPEVSLAICSDRNDDNKRLQHENIAKIVKTKDLHSLHEFEGVKGFAEALCTDLESGVPNDDNDPDCRPIAFSLSSETQEFLHFLLEACKSYIIFLLLVCAALSVGFGIKEEGPYTGWSEGALIFGGVVMLVSVHSIHNFWNARKRKMSKRSEPIVDVVRAGCQRSISISKVKLGEIVCLKKGNQVPADGVFISGESLQTDNNMDGINYESPFLFYGEKVVNGDGRMLVTSVGKDRLWDEMMSKVTCTTPNEKTPLHVQLDKVNTCVQIIGVLIAILIVVIVFLRFHFGNGDHDRPAFPDLKVKPTTNREFVDAIEKFVRKPKGKISVLTASLTMLLVGMTEGIPFVIVLAIFYWNKKILSGKGTAQDSQACICTGSVTTICTDKAGGLTLGQMEVDRFFIGGEIIANETVIASDVPRLLCNVQNDDPILLWASQKLGTKMGGLEQPCAVVEDEELNPDKEGREILMRKNRDSGESTSSHCKGPATTILATCSRYYDIKGKIEVIDKQKRTKFEEFITDMQIKHLKPIAYAYRNAEEDDLILLGLVVLRHSCRKAIEDCMTAGVNVKLVSGDNVSELEAIAQECGIPMLGSDAVMLGEQFRNFTEEERIETVDRISVMGNCLPSDRLLLVKCLKQKGHIVAVVGDKMEDSPALKEADVGIALGSKSTEMAKECSDIIVLDRNLEFMVTIMKSGRCAHENIRKFLQLQLTMSISWFLINPITTACFGDAPISAIQSLWVYLIVTFLGGPALLTEPPPDKVRGKPPMSRDGRLVTRTMWRNIVLQTCYQVAILLTFRFKGQAILGIREEIINTMIFNIFALCQIFNQFNAREPEMKNVLKGIFRNCWFWLAIVATMVLQEAFMEISRVAGGGVRLNYLQWAVCLLIGFVSYLLDWAGKCTADFITGLFARAHTSDSGYIGLTSTVSNDAPNNLDPLLQNENPV